jgi:RimJ/RimL family protein N-acetyltransferase
MNEYGLKQIYWNTNPQNLRAVRFQEKIGSQRIQPEDVFHIEGYSEEEIKYYNWYAVYALS